MRVLPFLVASGASAAALAWIGVAGAQVSDAERAAARELFKQGDELQRAGRFAEALDKFERAQQVFGAPTNQLRIAECDAALGRLVESAEAYRAVVRTVLPAGSPPAFQAAVDQAKAELGQVEPRVPRLTVQVQPTVDRAELRIDGQTVPSALIGEPMPLDPGRHQVAVTAPGYAPASQVIELKERESRPVPFVLQSMPMAALPLPPPPAPISAPPPPAPPYFSAAAPAPRGVSVERPAVSRLGLLLGGHLGGEILSGSVPVGDGKSVNADAIASAGFAFGADAGIRFARHWFVGGVVEHASLGQGNRSELGSDVVVSSDTTLAAVTFGFIGNPDWTSFYGEVGIANRWLHYRSTCPGVAVTSICGPIAPADSTDSSAEFTLGAGVWIPAGHSFRLLPKATLGLGAFNQPDQDSGAATATSAPWHTFFMIGIAGFYNLDF
jgi:hypothetical protein